MKNNPINYSVDLIENNYQWRCAADVKVEEEAPGEVRLPNARDGDLDAEHQETDDGQIPRKARRACMRRVIE